MSGQPHFNPGKFRELIVYFARRLGPEAALGRVKLAKLLMRSDFGAFERLGQPITGATYEKWEHGHLPRELLLAVRDLEASGAIVSQDVEYFGKTLHQMTAGRDPDLSEFSDDEVAIIEGALRQFGHESASYLSDLSHRDSGWQSSAWHEPIPYETALTPTERPRREVMELARRRFAELRLRS